MLAYTPTFRGSTFLDSGSQSLLTNQPLAVIKSRGSSDSIDHTAEKPHRPLTDAVTNYTSDK